MKNRRHRVNRTSKIVEPESEKLNMPVPMEEPNTDLYQGYDDTNDFYTQAKQGCLIYDSLIANLVKRKFSMAELENMTTEQALEVFNALEKARATRSQFYLDICTKLSNDAFYNRQLELERGKIALNLMDKAGLTNNDNAGESEENTDKNSENKKIVQQKIIRLLQEAIQSKLDKE